MEWMNRRNSVMQHNINGSSILYKKARCSKELVLLSDTHTHGASTLQGSGADKSDVVKRDTKRAIAVAVAKHSRSADNVCGPKDDEHERLPVRERQRRSGGCDCGGEIVRLGDCGKLTTNSVRAEPEKEKGKQTHKHTTKEKGRKEDISRPTKQPSSTKQTRKKRRRKEANRRRDHGP